MAKILVMGTTHEIQEKDYENTQEFRKVLRYLTEQHGVASILEEWTAKRGPTVGRRFADEHNLVWKDIGTPATDELATMTPLFDPSEDPPMVINRYGPIDVQTQRETMMVQAIQAAIQDATVALVICGMAHLHSLCGKLTNARVEVQAFNWTRPPITLEI